MNLWTIYTDVEKVSQSLMLKKMTSLKQMAKSGSEPKSAGFKIQAKFDENIFLTFDLPLDHRYGIKGSYFNKPKPKPSYLWLIINLQLSTKIVFRIMFTLNAGTLVASSELICVDTVALAVFCDGHDILKCTVS